MSLPSGFTDQYPGNEAAYARQVESLRHLDVEQLALEIAHAVEIGEFLRATAAEQVLRETQRTAEQIFGDFTIPDSWREETK